MSWPIHRASTLRLRYLSLCSPRRSQGQGSDAARRQKDRRTRQGDDEEEPRLGDGGESGEYVEEGKDGDGDADSELGSPPEN